MQCHSEGKNEFLFIINCSFRVAVERANKGVFLLTRDVEPALGLEPPDHTVLCWATIWFRASPESCVDRSSIRPSPVSLRVSVRCSNPEVKSLLTGEVSQKIIFSFSFHLDEVSSHGGAEVSGLGPVARVSYQTITLASTSTVFIKLRPTDPLTCVGTLYREVLKSSTNSIVRENLELDISAREVGKAKPL